MNLTLLILSLTVVPTVLADQRPGDVLDLSHWKLTLPVDTELSGSPDEVRQPDLNSYRDVRFFDTLEGKKAVVFRAQCGGVPTKGSKYPRAELREMQADGKAPASWGIADGSTHTLTARLAITKTPARKPHVIFVQIHDESEKLLAIRIEGTKLLAEGDSQDDLTITKNYVLGTPFTIKVVASNGNIRLMYDDRVVLDWKDRRSGCYFKIGCYTQSNVGSGDLAEAIGEVIVYDLDVSHTK